MEKVKQSQIKKLDASKSGFDIKLGKLPFEKFEKWFNDHYEGDAKLIHADLQKKLEKTK